jgi:hypothetical protein
MFDMLFDGLRKAQESSMQIHHEMVNYWTQPWAMASGSSSGSSNPSEWGRSMQRRWADATLELLNKHREALDSMYRSGIELIEQSFQVARARSPEDLRQMTEELWRKLLDVSRQQSETQFREAQRWAEKSFEMTTATTTQNGKA